jgi:hypothetical protein
MQTAAFRNKMATKKSQFDFPNYRPKFISMLAQFVSHVSVAVKPSRNEGMNQDEVKSSLEYARRSHKHGAVNTIRKIKEALRDGKATAVRGNAERQDQQKGYHKMLDR